MIIEVDQRRRPKPPTPRHRPPANVKGFATWVEKQHTVRPCSPLKHRFGVAPRFKAEPQAEIEQDDKKQRYKIETKAIVPTLSFSFSRSERNTHSNGLAIPGASSPGPAHYGPKFTAKAPVKSPVVYRPRSVATKQRRIQLELWAQREQTVLKNRREKSTVVEETKAPPTMGTSYDFSKVIGKRLLNAKGTLPGPGAYDIR